jgi:hypothetical protein
MGIGCRTCKSCQTEPYLVDNNCPLCWNCENDEGLLRWDVNDNNIDEVIEQIKEKMKKKKLIEIEAK